MNIEINLSAADLVPQQGGMCLLDKVICADDDHLVANAVFSETSLFCRNGQVGSWVSLECMAQAIAAWAGYQGRIRGNAPQIGFLLGCSQFTCHKPFIGLGSPLRIEVRKEIQLDNGLGQFTARTYQDDQLLAAAVITVMSPEDPAAVISSATNG
jgi:predicted hotdog family 3-hydroxylacyl-ACP dehydratase